MAYFLDEEKVGRRRPTPAIAQMVLPCRTAARTILFNEKAKTDKPQFVSLPFSIVYNFEILFLKIYLDRRGISCYDDLAVKEKTSARRLHSRFRLDY